MAAMTGQVNSQLDDTFILVMCSVADRSTTDHLANELIAFIVGVVDEHVPASVVNLAGLLNDIVNLAGGDVNGVEDSVNHPSEVLQATNDHVCN